MFEGNFVTIIGYNKNDKLIKLHIRPFNVYSIRGYYDFDINRYVLDISMEEGHNNKIETLYYKEESERDNAVTQLVERDYKL